MTVIESIIHALILLALMFALLWPANDLCNEHRGTMKAICEQALAEADR